MPISSRRTLCSDPHLKWSPVLSPNRFSQKANLQAIVSILAIGILRRRVRNEWFFE